MLSLPADDPHPAGHDLSGLEADIASRAPEPGAKLVHWVLVAEWQDTEGFRMIDAQTNAPPWTSSGLIRWAADNEIAYGGDDE